mgnify:CR=1 FL=1
MTQLIKNIEFYLIDPFITLLIAAGLLMFFWGLAEFILSAGNEDGRSKGKKHMLWGIVGLFIMVSAKAIIEMLRL